MLGHAVLGERARAGRGAAVLPLQAGGARLPWGLQEESEKESCPLLHQTAPALALGRCSSVSKPLSQQQSSALEKFSVALAPPLLWAPSRFLKLCHCQGQVLIRIRVRQPQGCCEGAGGSVCPVREAGADTAGAKWVQGAGRRRLGCSAGPLGSGVPGLAWKGRSAGEARGELLSSCLHCPCCIRQRNFHLSRSAPKARHNPLSYCSEEDYNGLCGARWARKKYL